MSSRFIFGRHPLDGSYGAWLSKPGIDVRYTVNPDDMLITPSKKNEQILMSGIIGLAPNENGSVYYPNVYDAVPFVQAQISDRPDLIARPSSRGGWTAGAIIYIAQYVDHVEFQNRANIGAYFFYTVCVRNN